MATPLDFKELQESRRRDSRHRADQVQLDKSFAKDLAADSLDLVELIAAVEDKYDVELPEDGAREDEDDRRPLEVSGAKDRRAAGGLGDDGDNDLVPHAFRRGAAPLVQGQRPPERDRRHGRLRAREGDQQLRPREDDGHVRQMDHRAHRHSHPPHRRAWHYYARAGDQSRAKRAWTPPASLPTSWT